MNGAIIELQGLFVYRAAALAEEALYKATPVEGWEEMGGWRVSVKLQIFSSDTVFIEATSVYWTSCVSQALISGVLPAKQTPHPQGRWTLDKKMINR